jgi:para-aminobenzoate synthetase component 1
VTREPWAHFGGRLATGLVEVADLAERPTAFDHGFWVIRATFEGSVVGYRFNTVRSSGLPAAHTPWRGPGRDDWIDSLERDAYLAGMSRIKKHIEAGDVYQVNLCRRLRAPLPAGADPAALAHRVAAGNPAPYQGVLDTGDEWLVSASPELFLARRGDELSSAPIKGTASRSGAFAVKDTAENVMITDLVRNDLNRVCLPHSVRVTELLAEQAHPGLVHLVTTVTGALRDGVGWADIFAATFPPGSVSGAPKIRALEVIRELEPVPRDVYCGALGFIDAEAGTADLAVGIRTFFTNSAVDGTRWLNFGTGAGITYPSDDAAEWAETELKAARLLGLASLER